MAPAHASRIRLRVATVGHLAVASSRLRVYALLSRLPDSVEVKAQWVASDLLFSCFNRLASKPRRAIYAKVRLRFTARLLAVQSALGYAIAILRLMLFTRSGDFVLVQKLLFPHWVVRRLRRKAQWLVYDFDDAISQYSSRSDRRLAYILSMADCVITTDSNYAYASRCNSCVVRLPTPVDTTTIAPQPHDEEPVFRVGWIGSPGTTQYLKDAVSTLAQVGSTAKPIQYVFIGAAAFATSLPGVQFVAWSEQAERALLPLFDVGIMPLPSNEWTLGKGGFKAIQYMAAGVPTVATDLPVSRMILRPGVTGVLVAEGESWADAVETLLNSPRSRMRMAAAARRDACERFSIDVVEKTWRLSVFDGRAV